MKKYTLLKKISIVTAFTGILGVGICATWIQRNRAFDPPHSIPMRATPDDWAKQIKIGIIGDSWVAGHKLDHSIKEAMIASGIPSEVASSGHPGAKSRQIYRNLITNGQSAPHSSNYLLMDEDLDYLVIIAGVNDTVVHIGKKFYAYHMMLIIQAALDRGLHPVVVEVPEYGIEETPPVSFLSWVKNIMYLYLFDKGKVDVISDYRKALKDITPLSIKNRVTFVDFASIAKDYNNRKNLFVNPSHLNREGGDKLGKLIAAEIKKSHNNAIQADARTSCR